MDTGKRYIQSYWNTF